MVSFFKLKKIQKNMKKLLPRRPSNGNKGTFGKVLILGGCKGMAGSVCLSTEAALRSGSGLVCLGTVLSQQSIVQTKLTEATTLGFDEKDGAFSGKDADEIIKKINSCDACAFGMGFSRTIGAEHTVFEIIRNAKKPLIIDADGINALSRNINILKNINSEAVLTPHPGEMSRLLNLPVEEIQKNRTQIAKKFAKEYNVVLVLKGENTVVASPDGKIFINPTGNCGMATGGSGDVLSGIIASFSGQGLGLFDAAVLSVYLHGRAGDIAAKKYTGFGMKAGDIVEALPTAIKELLH